MNENTANKIKHLEFTQNTIVRMNTNSFQIKAFTITIISALIIFAARANPLYILIGIFPTILFWALDAYYLHIERKFRVIYNNVAGIKKDIDIKDFEMPIHKINTGFYYYMGVLFSKTLMLFYGVIFIVLIVSCISLQLFSSGMH